VGRATGRMRGAERLFLRRVLSAAALKICTTV
jgi:hypothetical protein